MTDLSKQRRTTDRHEAELVFHDRKYAAGECIPRHYRAYPTSPVSARLLAMMGDDLSGQHVLEYGCGTGWITAALASRGAAVSAFDISPEAVAQTTALLRTKGLLQRCSVTVMSGERLAYDSDMFDAAVGFAILHHLELGSSLAELRRVLKVGASARFAEPLTGNPIIKLYRQLTPNFRTVDEEPIELRSFRSHVSAFAHFEHHEQLILAIGALAFCYVPGLSRVASPVQRLLMRMDDALLRVVPSAGRWAWYSILVLRK